MVLFYAEENWRGKHAWERYRREREAKGDRFEWSAIVPPSVPDDQNFAATPLFAELFPKPPELARLDAVKLPACTNAAGSWREGRVENLAAWRSCYRFSNGSLLDVLSKSNLLLQEIENASHRPHARFPLRYEDNFNTRLPHLSRLRDLVRVYRLRALAELSAGRSDDALADIRISLRLADTIKDEPVLISTLVRVAIFDLTIQPVWEGLITHRWNEAQLTVLQTEFRKVNQFDSLAHALRGERVDHYQTIEWMRRRPEELFGFLELWDKEAPEKRLARLLGRAVPSGWFSQNELRVDSFYSQTLLPAIDFQHARVDSKGLDAANCTLETMRLGPYTICKPLMSAITIAIRKVVCSETAAQQAAVACALERYRLAHGQLPEKLEALVPEFIAQLPHDVINGQPLRYRRVAADQFILYSIGWNNLDDGGQVALTKTGALDLKNGDWVWFSQPQPSASERK